MNRQLVLSKLIICIVVFTAVFYKQDLGINLGLFCLFVWVLSYVGLSKDKIGHRFWQLSAAVLVSLVSFVWYGDALSFISVFISMYVLGIYLDNKRYNPLIYPLVLAYSFSSFIIRIFFFSRWIPNLKLKPGNSKRIFNLIILPLCIIIMFIGVYTSSSDMFAGLFFKFHFDINLPLILFYTLLGFYFMFNYWYILPIDVLNQLSNTMNDQLSFSDGQQQGPSLKFMDIKDQIKGGEITLLALNILLVFFLVIYNYEQYAHIPSGNSLSDEIHQRVNSIIVSIIMAIGVIMFYFRSFFNSDPKMDRLKKLAICWIFLNGLLILSAVIKNAEYIAHFGLTFKRIGVFIFLLLSIIGLLFTFIKISRQKTNLFLVCKMIRVFFIALIINSSINWSWVVTKYNLTYIANPDLAYLKSLDFNTELLYQRFNGDPKWKDFFNDQKEHIKSKRDNPFLSKILYYEYQKIE